MAISRQASIFGQRLTSNNPNGLKHNGEDQIESLARRHSLNEYFRMVSSHNHDMINRDTITFYHSNSIQYRRSEKSVKLELEDSYEVSLFFDMNGCLDPLSDAPDEGIELFLNGRECGVYIPKKNILWASDWVHDDDTALMFDEIWPRLAKALRLKTLKAKLKDNRLVASVGTDPEFEMLVRGQVVNAQQHVGRSLHDPIGVDGAGAQVELRPEPGTPAQVVRSLRGLLGRFSSMYVGTLGVQGDSHPLGGHIHIGVGREYQPPVGLLKMLDDFIGKPTLKLSGTARGGYLQLSAWETKPWGFEYRTPPACIFHNPRISTISLTMAKVLTERFINGEFIEYTDYPMPTRADFVSVAGLSEEDVDYYFDFLDNYWDYRDKNCIQAAWSVKEKKPPVEVTFGEAWDEDAKIAYAVALDKVGKKYGIQKFHLYGLRSTRGLAATVQVKGLELASHPNPNAIAKQAEKGFYCVGLPWVCRDGEWEKWVKPVVAAIEKKLKEERG